jgi:hypothetical protein
MRKIFVSGEMMTFDSQSSGHLPVCFRIQLSGEILPEVGA